MKSIILLLWSSLLVAMQSMGVLQADSGNSQESQSIAQAVPEYNIVAKWHGTWDVKAIRHQPQPAQEVTYEETFEWILDGRYLRSETSRKSDGGKSMSMVWYDFFSNNYQYVIYDASGLVAVLPPPTWEESTQTMKWKSGVFSPISYNGHATFIDADTIQWKSLWKDWKGAIILDLEGTSTRRK